MLAAKKFIALLKQYCFPFNQDKVSELSNTRCALHITNGELICLAINNATQALIHHQKFSCEKLAELPATLEKITNNPLLKQASFTWLLNINEYDIQMIESLAVAEEEIKDALYWRLKNLINYPLDNAAMDYFKIPSKKANQDNFMLAAVVAHKEKISPIVKLFETAKLSLYYITIVELALKNLASYYENDEKSTALIYLKNQQVILTITREKTLYFTRRWKYSSQEVTAAANEQLSLEVLRCFDYYQSQWRLPTPGRIFLLSEDKDTAKITQDLSKNLLLTVQPYTLPITLSSQQPVSTLPTAYYLNLACLLGEA